MKRFFLLLLPCLGLAAGCFTTRITFAPDRPAVADAVWDGRWYHNAIYGLAELSGPLPLNQICLSGVVFVDQETTFLAGLVEKFTSGVYSPQAVTIYCSDGKRARVRVDAEHRAVAYLDDAP